MASRRELEAKRWLFALGVAALLACSGEAREGPRWSKANAQREAKREVTSNVLRADYAGSESCAPCHSKEYAAWRSSPMHRMTRALDATEIHAPFDGSELTLRGDRAVMHSANGRRYLRVSSTTQGELLFRVTKVIGGRYREDFVGVEVDAAAPEGPGLDEERVLPVSYLRWNGELRYKGYSVMVRERHALERGLVWRQSCIFCHNTTSQLSTLYDELHGPGAAAYQGSASIALPPERGFRYEVTDPAGLSAALSQELAAQGVHADFKRRGVQRALRESSLATLKHFDERHLIELGIGCEMCHGGAREHATDPGRVLPSLAVKSDFLRVTNARGDAPSRAEDVNRVCARCHTVLFSRYPFTWEGRTRRGDPGGSNINSGEGRDFLLSSCSSALSCTSCHDPHGEDSAEALEALGRPSGNAVCTRCHDALGDAAALTRHSHHPAESAGSACLNCHMPRKNMGLAYELTRYHRVGSPTERDRVEGDRPLECALCHADKSVAQIVSALERFWGKRYDRRALRRLYGEDLRINVLRATLLGGKPHEVAVAASLAAEQGRSELLPLLVPALGNEYPLVRYFVHHAIEQLTGARVPLDLSEPGPEVVAHAQRWLEAHSAIGDGTGAPLVRPLTGSDW